MLNAADTAIKGGGSAAAVAGAGEGQDRGAEAARAGALDDRHARRQQRAHLADDGAPEPERRGSLAGRRVLPAGHRRPLSVRPQRRHATPRRPTSRSCSAPAARSTSCSSNGSPPTSTRRRGRGGSGRSKARRSAPTPAPCGQFQRAQAIRETFFPRRQRAGAEAAVQAGRDGSLDQATSSSTSTARSSATTTGRRSRRLSSWPGPRGAGQVRVTVNPPGSGTTFGTVFEGHGRCLRLFDRVNFEPVANSHVSLPRHLRRRRPQGGVRGHGEQRPQSVPPARAARLPVPDGPVTFRPRLVSSEMNQTSAAPTSARSPGWYGKLSTLGDFAQRRLPAELSRRAATTWLSTAMRDGREQLGERLARRLPDRAGAALRLGAGRHRRALVVRRADAELRQRRPLLPAAHRPAARSRARGPDRPRPPRALVRAPRARGAAHAERRRWRLARRARGRAARSAAVADATAGKPTVTVARDPAWRPSGASRPRRR